MLNYPEQDVLCHEYVYNDWDSEKVILNLKTNIINNI